MVITVYLSVLANDGESECNIAHDFGMLTTILCLSKRYYYIFWQNMISWKQMESAARVRRNGDQRPVQLRIRAQEARTVYNQAAFPVEVRSSSFSIGAYRLDVNIRYEDGGLMVM